MKKVLLSLVGLAALGAVSAQDKIKDGTVTGSATTPNASAVLDLESKNKALLLPRVSLSTTTTFTLTGSQSATAGFTVYNTNAGITSSSTTYPAAGVGTYVWDGTGWIATKYVTPAAYVEPWNVQGGSTAATGNSQNIYQTGSVAIGRQTAYTDGTTAVALDVRGAVRGGVGQAGTVGVNSTAFGNAAKATGTESFATGNNATASGSNAVALGLNTTSSGLQSVALGNGNTASGSGAFAGGYFQNSFGASASGISSFAFGAGSSASATNAVAFSGASALGQNSFAFGPTSQTDATSANSVAIGSSARTLYNHSVAMGIGVTTPVRSGAVFGRWNAYQSAIAGSDNGNNLKGDPLFQIGTGSSAGTRANLITGFTGMNWVDGSYDYGQVVINGTGTADANGVIPSTPITPARTGAIPANLSVYGTGGIAATGSVTASNYYVTNGTQLTVPDYVFQKYYTGTSTLKNDYHFTSNLYDVEKFLKANHHLPGVISAKEIAEAGSYDLGNMSVQTLEKTEELYLHVIEQQKQIDSQKATINTLTETLKSFTERLNQLEANK